MRPDKILLIHCAEGAKKAIKRMAELGHSLPGDVVLFELPCAGRVNEVLLMEALEKDYRHIIVVGCHKDNCRYMNGNLRAEKRIGRVNKLLQDAGIQKGTEHKRIEMIFIAPDEGLKLSQAINAFIEKTKEQGVTHAS